MTDRPTVQHVEDSRTDADPPSNLTLFGKYVPAEPTETPCNTAPENQDSAANGSKDGQSEDHNHANGAPELQPPPPAKILPRRDQVDGAPEDTERDHKPQSKFSYASLCGSLKGLPSKLESFFNKDKKKQNKSEDALRTPSPLTLDPSPAPPSTWSRTLGRFMRKRGAARPTLTDDVVRGRSKSSRRRLLARSRSSYVSPRDELRFDDPAAPQAFGGPTHEEDTMSSLEPQFSSPRWPPRTQEQERMRIAVADHLADQYNKEMERREMRKREEKGKGRAKGLEHLPPSNGGSPSSAEQGASSAIKCPASTVIRPSSTLSDNPSQPGQPCLLALGVNRRAALHGSCTHDDDLHVDLAKNPPKTDLS
ncbi:MAG: hypothetical protein Q9222_005583 [Ikaeria aurantiellina]